MARASVKHYSLTLSGGSLAGDAEASYFGFDPGLCKGLQCCFKFETSVCDALLRSG